MIGLDSGWSGFRFGRSLKRLGLFQVVAFETDPYLRVKRRVIHLEAVRLQGARAGQRGFKACCATVLRPNSVSSLNRMP